MFLRCLSKGCPDKIHLFLGLYILCEIPTTPCERTTVYKTLWPGIVWISRNILHFTPYALKPGEGYVTLFSHHAPSSSAPAGMGTVTWNTQPQTIIQYGNKRFGYKLTHVPRTCVINTCLKLVLKRTERRKMCANTCRT